jgi:hypothetical protein
MQDLHQDPLCLDAGGAGIVEGDWLGDFGACRGTGRAREYRNTQFPGYDGPVVATTVKT